VYDLRTNMRFTLKTSPLQRSDLDEFVNVFRQGKRHLRKPTWGEGNPQGRWRSFTFEELSKREKLNLDIFWLKDESQRDADSLPDPDVLADEIAEELESALALFKTVAKGIRE
jgi:type I restriction enzyme M protein